MPICTMMLELSKTGKTLNIKNFKHDVHVINKQLDDDKNFIRQSEFW